MNNFPRVILITGCSTGIGRAAAVRLAASGHTVYASARRIESIADLAPLGCHLLELDVTSATSMTAAVRTVLDEQRRIDALVNNAGYSLSGAVETLSTADIRRQFETNVFGSVRMAQLVLPAMRAAQRGRIVNIGSMGGTLTFPGGGAYHATKYAMEAFSDALRFEVKGFGIDVVLVQPGLIRSEFSSTAVAAVPTADGPYAEFNAAVARSVTESYTSGLFARLGGEPDSVASVIERAIGDRRPRPRMRVTPSAGVLMGLRRVLTDRQWDRFVGSQFPQPGPGSTRAPLKNVRPKADAGATP
ncbi:SDR family NAD(P)-dependent oxidoreductase [Microbacterium sp. DT81.1]|uniref:SDR family NAD(P)-dependent oxidoreductase n=1 Tax=Microbacterium sp. DT81.1 TaxID=3393413 RepID=UPI003CF1ECC0